MVRRGSMIRLGAVALLASGLACSGGGGAGKAPEISARVEGAEIPGEDTEALILAYLESPNGRTAQESEEFDKGDVAQTILSFQIKNEYLEQLARQKGVELDERQATDALALAQAAGNEDLKASGVRSKDLEKAFRNARLSQLIAEKQFPDAPVSETQLKNAYEDRKDAYEATWKIKGGMAVFASKDIAAKAREEVLAGRPFGEVAKELNATASADGEFSPQIPGAAPELLDALGTLQQGQLIEPYQFALDAWAIVQAQTREELPALSFEEAKASILDILEDRERSNRFNDWFFQKLKRAKVEVDGHYGEWDPSTGNVV